MLGRGPTIMKQKVSLHVQGKNVQYWSEIEDRKSNMLMMGSKGRLGDIHKIFTRETKGIKET